MNIPANNNMPRSDYELLRQATEIIMRLTTPVLTGKPGMHAFEFRMNDIRVLYAAALYLQRAMDEFDRIIAPNDPRAQAVVADFLKRFSNGDTN